MTTAQISHGKCRIESPEDSGCVMMNGVNGAAVWIWKRINDSKLPGIKFLGFNPYTGGNRCLLRHKEPIKGLNLYANFAWSTITEALSEELVQSNGWTEIVA